MKCNDQVHILICLSQNYKTLVGLVVAIVTYTLPTNLIPILTKISEYIMGHYIIDKELHHTFTHALLKFVFALCIAIGFISLEAFILRQHIYTKHLEFNGKRLFKSNPIK